MTAVLPTTVVAVFNRREDAERAVQDLVGAGFSRERIGLAVRQEPEEPPATVTEQTKASEGGMTGAVAGGALGGVLGAALIGLLPGIGPVLGVGVLAGLAGGAAAGAVAGGLVGTLIGLGIPEEEARQYQEELQAGRTILTVQADGRYDEAVQILRRHGARGRGKPLL